MFIKFGEYGTLRNGEQLVTFRKTGVLVMIGLEIGLAHLLLVESRQIDSCESESWENQPLSRNARKCRSTYVLLACHDSVPIST